MSDPGIERTRVRRVPQRGHYDRDTVYAILGAALICHVAFADSAVPHIIPMAMARVDDDLLPHGSNESRLMRVLANGADVCIAVTHVDGIVVSRSGFDSSMNSRSVVVFGWARALSEPTEKVHALRVLVNHLIPGRWHEARQPNDQELKTTSIVSVSLDEASAKIRSGPPQDDEADLHLPVWAGEIPLTTSSPGPVSDPLADPDLRAPNSVKRFLTERLPIANEQALEASRSS